MYPLLFDAVEIDLHTHQEHEEDETEVGQKTGKGAWMYQAEAARSNRHAKKKLTHRGWQTKPSRHKGHKERPQVKNDQRKCVRRLHELARGKKGPGLKMGIAR